MYKIERGSLEEYMELAHNSIESGKADYASLKPCTIYKLTHNGAPLVLLGYRKIEFEEYPGKPFIVVSGVFRSDISKHVRVLLEVGNGFWTRYKNIRCLLWLLLVTLCTAGFLKSLVLYTQKLLKKIQKMIIYIKYM